VCSYPRHWPLLKVAVAEDSMLPGLRPGDWLVARRTRRIRPGQVVLAWHPARQGFLLVKRAARRVEGDGEAGGGWWLESDNPAAGAVDSRHFGPVPERLIVGRVLARYWPVKRHLSRTIPPDRGRPRTLSRGCGAFRLSPLIVAASGLPGLGVR
jgi:nickel-type superoxide dismutase maturation protease